MSDVTPEMREAEPFRWCIYCNVDCDAQEPHRDDCPTNTNVWPVTEKLLLCPGCGVTHIGMKCTRCEYEFKPGDTYMLLEIEPGDPDVGPGASFFEGAAGASVNEAVCMTCAWTASGTSGT